MWGSSSCRRSGAGCRGKASIFKRWAPREQSAPSTSLRANGSRERAPDDRLREAIHLTAAPVVSWIASSQALLAMTLWELRLISTSRYASAFSRHDVARGLLIVVPRKRGSRECRMRAAPAVSCANWEKRPHTSIQGSGEHPTFPAQWLYGLSRAHPGELGPLLPPSPHGNRHLGPVGPSAPPQDLTPTTEASGPHAFAVRFGTARLHVLKTAHGVYPALQSHSRARCRRVHRIPSQRSVTMANAPSSGTGWRES